MAKMPRIKHGEFVGVMRGKHSGKVGVVVKIGVLYVSVQFPNVDGLPIVLKEDVIRILKVDGDGDGRSV